MIPRSGDSSCTIIAWLRRRRRRLRWRLLRLVRTSGRSKGSSGSGWGGARGPGRTWTRTGTAKFLPYAKPQRRGSGRESASWKVLQSRLRSPRRLQATD
eukprot:9358967-Alexandrium_andersonii.AAC.2